MRSAHCFVSIVLPLVLGCSADPEPSDTEGATSGAMTSSSTSAASIDPSTTFDPCGTAGCGPIDGSTTLDCGTGSCCDVDPSSCPSTGTETEGATSTGADTDASTGSSSGTGGSGTAG